MMMKWAAALFGIVMSFVFTNQRWTPLMYHTPHDNLEASYIHIKDLNERAFFRTVFNTFESGNPRTESFDVGANRPTAEELRKYYESFDKSLKIIRPNKCPTKDVVIPTHYQNREAVDRNFLVFDVDQCK